MAVPDLEPMLAGAGVLTSVEGWVAEPKLDPWRARALVDPELSDGFAVRTRRGRTIAAPVPGIAELGRSSRRVVLDGELVAASRRRCRHAPQGHTPQRHTGAGQEALLANGALDYDGDEDPDGIEESMVNVAGF